MSLKNLQQRLNPAAWLEDVTGIVPDLWQRDLLYYREDTLCMTGRQMGKSTMVAAKACHRAVFYPKSLVLILAPSQRQSQELGLKVSDICSEARLPVVDESQQKTTFTNKSRIICLPGSEATIRGYSAANLLIIDEASRVEDGLYLSVRPFLAVSGGQLVAITTPYIRSGWFYNAWETLDSHWKKIKVTADDNPRITKVFLESERESMPNSWFRSEYFCEWLDSGEGCLFNPDDIKSCVSSEIEELEV